MKARKYPTFGQIRRYLEGLGFTHRLWDDEGYTHHVYEHAASGCKLFFRGDRSDEDVLRLDEVHPVYHHLWWRSLIDDDVDFDQFLADFVAAKTS